MNTTVSGYPATSDRARGWLRYLHRKATTPDDWSKNGQPHAHWDNKTVEPMQSWHRFDLTESSYAPVLMSDITPAWREVYGEILEEFVYRFTGWWAAGDWLTQFGDDPDRKNYSEDWKTLIPPHLVGSYNVPGWTANGAEPWELNLDPIGADGNLFFKGDLLMLLGFRGYVTGDDKWNQPFEIARGGDEKFMWTHSDIANHLSRQWSSRAEGCH